jgi:hypothetical protein
MGKVFVSVGMSLDGFIAGPNRRPKNPLATVPARMPTRTPPGKWPADHDVQLPKTGTRVELSRCGWKEGIGQTEILDSPN